jgi:hypothetical protein
MTFAFFALATILACVYYARFVRASVLNISSNGIVLEGKHGNRAKRFSWRDLESVEVRRPAGGPIWTFLTKEGQRVRWNQTDSDGDLRLKLESVLIEALREHRIPVALVRSA